MTPDKVEENIKSALVPWIESFGTKQTFDKVITAIDNLHRRVAELESLAYPVAVDVDNEGKIFEEIDEEDMTEFERKLAQAILGALEHRGFYDCGKYLDSSLIEHIRLEHIRPLLTQYHQH